MNEIYALFPKYLGQIVDLLIKFSGRLLIVLLVLFLSKKFYAPLIDSYKKLADKKHLDPLLKSFLSSLIKTVYSIVVILIVIQVIGVQAVSLATLLGTAGLAIGLALQGSLSNLAGGILILFFRPFNQGDYILSSVGVEGSVHKIRILYTELTTPDNKSIQVPNGVLANNPVTNFSRNPERRVDFVFSVSYDTSIDKAIALMSEVAESHPAILKDHDRTIRLLTQSTSSLDFAFRVWCKKEDYWTVYFDCNERVKHAFDENGIEIPYQKIDIYKRV